jgi:ribosome-binding protein aMBF1 (putative translation factor)
MHSFVCQSATCCTETARVHAGERKARSEEVALRFGRNLFRCRRRAGLSQEQLGARASLHRTEIGLLEHGKRVARVDTVIQLAGAMGVAPADLLEGIHWTPAEERRGGFSFTDPPPAPRRRRG